MAKKKKGYLNNKDFLELLKEYEQYNDSLSRWFDKKNPEEDALKRLTKKANNNGKEFVKDDEYHDLVKRYKEFKDRKEELYKKRVKMLETETPEEKEARLKKLERIKNRIGKCFLAIAENYIKKPNFINYDYFRKGSMVSDACLFMFSYVERFDLNLDNPFAYFSQVANSAFLQHINKTKKMEEKFPPVSFIENIMGDRLGDNENEFE